MSDRFSFFAVKVFDFIGLDKQTFTSSSDYGVRTKSSSCFVFLSGAQEFCDDMSGSAKAILFKEPLKVIFELLLSVYQLLKTIIVAVSCKDTTTHTSKLFNVFFGLFGRINDTSKNNFTRSLFLGLLGGLVISVLAQPQIFIPVIAGVAFCVASCLAITACNGLIIQPTIRTVGSAIKSSVERSDMSEPFFCG